jgi:hypothetical protein
VFTPRLPLHAITHHPSRRLIPHRHHRRDGHTLVDLDQPRKQRRTPTQLHTRLTRHLHNLKPRRRTLRAVDARPASLTLNIERLPTYLATSLRLHSLSLSIVAPLVVLGGDDCWGAGPEDAPRRKTDLLCRAFLLNHQRRELSNAGDDRKNLCAELGPGAQGAIPKIRFFAALSLLSAVMQVMGSSGIARVGRGT